jgi:hypothetical protein
MAAHGRESARNHEDAGLRLNSGVSPLRGSGFLCHPTPGSRPGLTYSAATRLTLCWDGAHVCIALDCWQYWSLRS